MLTPLSRRREFIYSDFDKMLEQNPVTNDIAMKTDDNAIKESIKNLLLTHKGERLFQPYIGSTIKQMLFEHLFPETMVILKEEIKNVIESFEPRCSIISIDVKGDPNKNLVDITITFLIINRVEPITMTLFLERTR